MYSFIAVDALKYYMTITISIFYVYLFFSPKQKLHTPEIITAFPPHSNLWELLLYFLFL